MKIESGPATREALFPRVQNTKKKKQRAGSRCELLNKICGF